MREAAIHKTEMDRTNQICKFDSAKENFMACFHIRLCAIVITMVPDASLTSVNVIRIVRNESNLLKSLSTFRDV